jgi:hypothetical protein
MSGLSLVLERRILAQRTGDTVLNNLGMSEQRSPARSLTFTKSLVSCSKAIMQRLVAWGEAICDGFFRLKSNDKWLLFYYKVNMTNWLFRHWFD